MKGSLHLLLKKVKLLKDTRTGLFLCMCLLTSNLHAIDKEVVVSLSDEDRVLSSPVELHITSASNPLVNSTVSLNHEDAWLFFDNIKPSEVVSNYLDNVMVNGSAFSEGGNGRIAIYAHGTVIMPHSSSFKPLTVYTEDNFGGENTQYGLHTYNNSLGDFDNAIKSFKLKRGYMATLANNNDGSGYSRVFIADEADLEFTIVPDALYGSASFIRVLKYEWVTKKGWCGGAYEAGMSGSTWYYNWQAQLASTNDLEYVPMRAKLNWSPWDQINALQNVSHSLGLNEPDHAEQHKDDNGEQVVTVDQALAQWPEMLKSGLRVGAPATTDFGWLYDFMDRCDELNYRVDYVAVHSYWGSSAQAYYNSLKYVHERTGRPIWITEWNYGANWTSEWWPDDPSGYTEDNADHALAHISEIVNMFDTCHFIERYSIYNWVEDARAIVLNGALTKAGEFYANNNSVIAYDSQNDVVPGWNYSSPELSYRYLSLSNNIKLSWADSNGELSRGYKIEKKVNDGQYETIYTTDDVTVSSYNDPLDSEINGKITYKVSLLTSAGTYLSSEEVSYYQTGGVENVQVGNIGVGNTDWSSCVFSQKYATTPLVLLGLPAFNNVTAITKRANSITKTGFKLQLDPWLYLNNPSLTTDEDISVMAIPEGTYNFGNLKGEVAQVSGVTRDWVAVSFNQEFDAKPVVVCTQTSNSNSFPTVVAVRNVTVDGFEVSLRSEEDITTAMLGEKVNFWAIEPGQGSIEGKRITVGMTEEGDGLKSTPKVIEFDQSYTQPAYWGGLLSVANDFASTVRYYSYSDNSIKILKQREMSGGLASIGEDQVGWIIMDLAPDQTITSVDDLGKEDVKFYPNPAKEVIYFKLDKPTVVSVFDLTGQKLIEQEVNGRLSVNELPVGVYILEVEGKVQKFIKK